MPIFEIEQYELHTQSYRIEADTVAEAIKGLLEGEGDAVDGGLEFIEVTEERGIPIEECPEIVIELQKLGVSICEDMIPSVRSFREL